MCLALCFRIMSWWDYGYQIAGMANRTTLVDNNTWNNSHIALVWVNLRLLGYYIADTYSTFPYSRELEEELATLSSIQDTSHTMSLMNIFWCISASDRDRVRKWWTTFLYKCLCKMANRDEKLRHVAMAAKFLGDHKLKTSLKKWILTVSNFIHLICQMLAKFFWVWTRKCRKRKRQFLCCVHQLHKAGAWN